jgi:peroxiredoxin
MKKRNTYVGLVALAVVPLLPVISLASEGPAPTAPTLTSAGVLQPKYVGLRIGDIAPAFAFPEIGDANGPLWQSRNMLGTSPLTLLVVGPTAKPETTQQLLNGEFNQAARELKDKGIEPVVVVSAPALIKLEKSADQKYTVLRDDKNNLAASMGPNPAPLTLVAIDRAGFIRRVEAVDTEAAATWMRLIGDPTPKLEVGKPAPDFAISDMNGQVRRLADLRGQKNLLLTFFPKCFTGG